MSSKSSKAKSTATEPVQIDPHVMAFVYLDKQGKKALRFYRGEFWRWCDGRYRPLSLDQLRAEVTQESYEWANGDRTPFRITRSLSSNVLQALSGLTLVPDEAELPVLLERNGYSKPNLLSFANGLVDLDALLEGRPAELRRATPEWFSTVTLPYAFDPNAQCSRWEAFLAEIFENDQDRVHLLQEWFGYCLTLNTGEQKFLVLEGEGQNGKSVVCELLTAVLGEDNVSHVPLELFGDKFQLYTTLGKLANIATEATELKSVNEGQLKSFTSGDRMYFDRKGRSGVNARPTARLVIATNNRPRFSDRSSGLWRRMILIPFNFTIPEGRKDQKFPEKLKAELPGILNWAIAGERRRRAQGRFTMPKVCIEALQDYQAEMNPARVYLRECLEADPDGFVYSSDLYNEYVDSCRKNGHEPLSNPSFGKEVRRTFRDAKRVRESAGERVWVYRGIRYAIGSDPVS